MTTEIKRRISDTVPGVSLLCVDIIYSDKDGKQELQMWRLANPEVPYLPTDRMILSRSYDDIWKEADHLENDVEEFAEMAMGIAESEIKARYQEWLESYDKAFYTELPKGEETLSTRPSHYHSGFKDCIRNEAYTAMNFYQSAMHHKEELNIKDDIDLWARTLAVAFATKHNDRLGLKDCPAVELMKINNYSHYALTGKWLEQ
jgi:hypothetical protein